MNRRLFVLAVLALAGCASLPPPKIVAPARPLVELEPLFAARAGPDALTIRVASNGCTRKEDFAFYVERDGQTVTLSFGRKKLDTCKSFAMGHEDLTFSWAELGLPARSPVFLLNPLVAWTGPGD
jgi:hypothetical protein